MRVNNSIIKSCFRSVLHQSNFQLTLCLGDSRCNGQSNES